MNLEIVGTIKEVKPVVVISSKFRIREFVLELATEHNGIEYTDYAKMQLFNSNCDLLDENEHTETLRFVKGDKVKVTFSLKGTRHKEKLEFYNNLNAYKVVAYEQNYTPAVSAPVSQDARRDNFNAQTKQQDWSTMPPFKYPETIDDLPF